MPVGPPVSRRLAKFAFEGLLGVVADLCADLTDADAGRMEQPGGQVQSSLGQVPDGRPAKELMEAVDEHHLRRCHSHGELSDGPVVCRVRVQKG